MSKIEEAAKAASAAWESDEVSPTHTRLIMRLMRLLAEAIADDANSSEPCV